MIPTETLIIANGDLPDFPELPNIISQAQLIIAVDGGANHCRRLGIIPDVLIGDLDSIDNSVLEEFEKKMVTMHRHPRRKDATDLELTLELAMSRGARQISLLGGLGGRWDMSLATILLLAAPKFQALRFRVFGPNCVMHILHPGKPFHLQGTIGQTVSFMPLLGDVTGLTLRGFDYPLREADLPFGSTQGISNELVSERAEVKLRSGVLLCVVLTSLEA